MKALTLALAMTIAAASGSAQAASPEHDMSQQQAATQTVSQSTHDGVGVLKEIDAKTGKLKIAHEPIAALHWPPMTMWFALRNPLPQDLKVGDAVRFELMQNNKDQWVIVKIGRK